MLNMFLLLLALHDPQITIIINNRKHALQCKPDISNLKLFEWCMTVPFIVWTPDWTSPVAEGGITKCQWINDSICCPNKQCFRPCSVFDYDKDNDVDLKDYALWMRNN